MGSTFVGIDDNGFWMRDGLLELWLRLLALHIEDAKDRLAPAHHIRDGWLLASRGYFNGCVPLDLKADTASPEGRRVVLGAIHSLVQALQHAPDALDAGVLNLMGMDGTFTQGIHKAQLVEIGQAFLDLLDGHRFGGPSDASFMPGSRV